MWIVMAPIDDLIDLNEINRWQSGREIVAGWSHDVGRLTWMMWAISAPGSRRTYVDWPHVQV